MKTTTVLALVGATTVAAHSSNISVMNCQNGSTCTGANQSGPNIGLSPTVKVGKRFEPVPRGLQSLFSRNPELGAYLTIRNANAGEMTVNQLVTAIHAHNIPADILAAGKARGWSPPASKRSLIEARSELTARAGGGHVIPGKHGDPIPTHHVSAFIKSGAAFPEKITAALKAVGWVQGGAKGKGATGGKGGAAPAAKAGKKGKRDFEEELHARDIYGDIWERSAEADPEAW